MEHSHHLGQRARACFLANADALNSRVMKHAGLAKEKSKEHLLCDDRVQSGTGESSPVDTRPLFSAIGCVSHLETSPAVFSAPWYDHASRASGTGWTAPMQRSRSQPRSGHPV